jgi:23S rRNA (cytosine1962-C5)-methyltransferase
LNALAIKGIKPGGIIFTFSCSQVVDKSLFNGAITAAAIETGRTVRIVRYLSQPADHPINIYHPEGEYLKGMILHVE